MDFWEILTVKGSPLLHHVVVSVLIHCTLLIYVVTLLMCHCPDLTYSSGHHTNALPSQLVPQSQVPPAPQPSMEVPRLHLLICLYLLARLQVLDPWTAKLPKACFSFSFLFMKVSCPLRNSHLENCPIFLIGIFKRVLWLFPPHPEKFRSREVCVEQSGACLSHTKAMLNECRSHAL